MVALNKDNPRVVSGPPMARITKLIKNGDYWKAGEFLNDGSSGYLNVCVSDDDAGAGGIKYYAFTDQTDPADTTTEATVGVITRDHEFEGNELDGILASTDINSNVAIDVTSNIVTVDVGDASNPAVEITNVGHLFDPAQYDATDTNAKVRFRVLTVALEAAPA